MCQVPWLVIHPDSVNDEAGYSRKKSLASETERFKRFGELAAKYGTGIAIENMVDHLGIGYGRRFGCNAEDLLELLDKLNADDIFGICWDTGHANLAQVNQPAAIQQIGSRLKALHINDNRGEKDDHLLPYLGYVEWTPLLKSLADVNYQGDFTYEIHNFTGGMSPEIHQQGVEFSVLVETDGKKKQKRNERKIKWKQAKCDFADNRQFGTMRKKTGSLPSKVWEPWRIIQNRNRCPGILSCRK